ncbi:MAG: endonuclease/exonuclease/phosphatase family protein [Puniceicoccaceae bacterium]
MNIAHGRGQIPYQGMITREAVVRQMRKIGGLIKKLDSDIVCLQEVDKASHWNRRVDLLETLFEMLDHGHRYQGIHNLRGGKLPLAYGNAILSRHTIARQESVAFGARTLGEKGFVLVEVELGRRLLPILNVHLDYRSRVARIEQVERILGTLEGYFSGEGVGSFHPPLVCGDFNTSERNRGDAVHLLFEELRTHHAYQLIPAGARTFPALIPIKGIDFILASEAFRLTRQEVVRTFLSDHRPVVAEFELDG